MRNYLWLLFICCSWASVKAKPLVSFGLGVQQAQSPYSYPPPGEQYYNNYYGNDGGYYGGAYSRYPAGYPYAPTYPSPIYSPGQRYGAALDIGIGALSLTPFLL